ncbi:MAG: general secretion pathway protein GspB [Alteromonadaceae bacterium]|nr:general secretion pathway protein GspB [Alteromonadaceae bacterium]
MNQIIAIEQARPGMMILRVTAQNGPVKINKSGLITSEAMIQGLIEMGVQEIEYDPDQTVEICQDRPLSATEQTPTQALLRGQFDTRAQKTDSAISEQFNRSLFLPSVNGLPGWWQRSVKPVAIAVLMLLGGASTGYALAVLPEVLSQVFTAPAPSSATSSGTQNSSALRSANNPNNERPQDTVSKPAAIEPQPQSVTESQSLLSADKPQNSQGVAATTAGEVVSQPSQTADTMPQTSEQASNGRGSEEDVAVSPELMARFNKVMADLEQEEERGEPLNNNTVVNIHDDIQRVDQLPARLLTRLPTMDFSAHMYASRPADRWVRVNGLDKSEGDWINDKVQIVNIEAQRVILRFEGEVFAMSALTDW